MEFEPSQELDIDLSESLPHFDLLTEPNPVQLEKRGTTSQTERRFAASQKHKNQGSLFKAGTLHKDSIAAKLRTAGHLELASQLEHCHSEKLTLRCTDCRRTVTVFNRCDLFFCPCCTPRLSNERRESIEFWTKSVDQPKHVVLTCRNSRDMTKGHVRQVKKWFSALRRTTFATKKTYWWKQAKTGSISPLKEWKERSDEGETVTSSPWKGGFYSLEVTNESRGWHLHIHALVDARFIDERVLSYMWDKVSNGFGKIVKVKDCRDKSYLQEVTKYAVKGSMLAKWSAADIFEFISAFKGIKTFGVFGSLYGKRTEWREYLETVKEKRSRCECGCNSFQCFDEREWEVACAMLMPDSRRSIPPPNPVGQYEFAGLLISPSFHR